ncbi:MAG: Archaeal holliday junction resolvase (hjc) [Candidatus Methanofastidiosum methylothiophilum]|uniref:Archaeal holliday junction resolvase (Hjc) n=1 Tax=Candidatus Methanofastidiosum methylothiophilum TaxID=1705564 RepID=A0A150IL04_9EURY|nr:MAG: Archaeal holliday junction resolvase (hjc) [Candidatus Methanofastidiosum methylthiophilus]KYC47972.1 MAG: Archaeal holliday junction resolvase (hjc) [Candidatus Methanofastidiosum methylthiophilus]KYC50590.1 MAG: Archaeal holliday junction resolvase (hjc) [Candidatus Methanofastidiosum methylthiophilus]
MSITRNKSRGVRAEYEVKKYLLENGYFVFSKRVSQSGPDIIAIKGKKTLILEVKNTKLSTLTIKKSQINSLIEAAAEISAKTVLLPKALLAVKFSSKEYGWAFISIENQSNEDKIIRKEHENLLELSKGLKSFI